MNRKRSREIAMEILYQMDMTQSFDVKEINNKMDRYEEDIDRKYLTSVLEMAIINQPLSDEKISQHLQNWKIERISKIDLAILRVAIAELLWVDSIPKKVSINEAINLGKKFGDENSGKFINGILSHFINEDLKGNDNRD